MSENAGPTGPTPTDSAHLASSAEPGSPGAGSSGGPNRRNLYIALGIVAAVIIVGTIWWLGGEVAVPRVVGLQQEAAALALEAAQLKVGKVSEEPTLAVEPGTVTGQMPLPAVSVREGSNVDLVVAAVPVSTVPDVTGKTSSEAEAELAAAGLRVGDVTGAYSTEEQAGTVLDQSPPADTEVNVASAVSLEMSAGPKQGAVPDVTGLVSVDAADVLEAAGFAVKETKKESADVAAGVVMAQSPSAGTVAESGTTVTNTVSTGVPASAESAPPPATEPPITPENPPAEKPGQKPETTLTEVPSLIGMRVLEALSALRKAELQFSIEWGPTEDAFLQVVEQDPRAGADIDRGSVVSITIGLPSFLFEGVEVQPLPAEPPSELPSGAGEGSDAATSAP